MPRRSWPASPTTRMAAASSRFLRAATPTRSSASTSSMRAPSSAPVVVFLHGNPSWSYIWRHQIAAAVAGGLPGHRPRPGRHGPVGQADRDDRLHRDAPRRVDACPRSSTSSICPAPRFVLHDWGGIIGMRLAAENPGLVERLVISNTGLPWRDLTEPLPDVIEASGPLRRLPGVRTDDARVAAVDAAADGDGDRAERRRGARLPRALPRPVADDREPGVHPAPADPARQPDVPGAMQAWDVFDAWTKPVLTIFSDKDAVAPDGWKPIVARIPGATGPAARRSSRAAATSSRKTSARPTPAR